MTEEAPEKLEQCLIAHEQHRQLLADTLHDGLIQDLTAASLYLDVFQAEQTEIGDQARRHLDQALESLRGAMDAARRVMADLRSPLTENGNDPTEIE